MIIILLYVFSLPEAGVTFAEQAIVEFRMRQGQVEDVNHVERVAAAYVLDEFGGQVQDGGDTGSCHSRIDSELPKSLLENNYEICTKEEKTTEELISHYRERREVVVEVSHIYSLVKSEKRKRQHDKKDYRRAHGSGY